MKPSHQVAHLSLGQWTLLLCTMVAQIASAQMREYWVAFDSSKTAISLDQVDTLNLVARQLGTDPAEKIVVYAYASDAGLGDDNERLVRRRSYLIQQCLERAGVPLNRLHIRHFTCGPDELGCPIGARIWVEHNAELSATNLYQSRNLAYVWAAWAKVYEQRYTVHPFRDTILTLRSNHQLYVPAGSFKTKDTAKIRLTIRELPTPQDQWLHGIFEATRQLGTGVLQVAARQNGQTLPHALKRPLSLVEWNVPQQAQVHQPYWYREEQWLEQSQHRLPLYTMQVQQEQQLGKDCQEGVQAPSLPVFETPPARPNYEHPDTASALQDQAIRQLAERLEELEAVRYNKNGKKEIWTTQQKERAYQLKNQRDRLLVQREELRRAALDRNTELEEAYYRAMATYTQQRNQQQQAYLQQKAGLEQQSARLGEVCTAYEQRQRYLAEAYTPQQLDYWQRHLLAQPALAQHGHFWTTIPQLGTLATRVQATPNPATATLEVKLPADVSAYKVTAVLFWGDHGVLGQPTDAQTLVFPQYKAQQNAVLWAVVETPAGHRIALQRLEGQQPITLVFDQTELVGQAILEASVDLE